MVEIHFKTFSPLAAASASVVITAQSAPTEVVRSQVVRRGAVIRGVLSVQWSTSHSSPQAAGSAGEWPATTAAPAKVGALTRSLSVCAHLFRVSHRLLHLDRRRLQGQTHHSRRLRIVAMTGFTACEPTNARAVSSRTSTHAFHSHRTAITRLCNRPHDLQCTAKNC